MFSDSIIARLYKIVKVYPELYKTYNFEHFIIYNEKLYIKINEMYGYLRDYDLGTDELLYGTLTFEPEPALLSYQFFDSKLNKTSKHGTLFFDIIVDTPHVLIAVKNDLYLKDMLTGKLEKVGKLHNPFGVVLRSSGKQKFKKGDFIINKQYLFQQVGLEYIYFAPLFAELIPAKYLLKKEG